MAFDTYIQMDPIKGESTDEKHKEWVEVFSFSHGLSQQGAGSVSGGQSRVAGKVDVQDFTITKRMDTATPYLNQYCCSGKHLKKATVEICRNTGKKEVLMKYTFDDVVISGVNVGGGQGQEVPVETVSFTFSKVKWEYTGIDSKTGAAGKTIPASHDLVTNVTS